MQNFYQPLNLLYPKISGLKMYPKAIEMAAE